MKTSFNHNFTVNITRHCFEADSLSPVESPVCRSEAGFSRYAYVFGDNCTIGLAARRVYG